MTTILPDPGSPRPRRTFLREAAGALLLPGAACRFQGPARAPAGPALPRIRSDADVDRLLPGLTNWGRWGPEDRLGTLNHLTPERRRAAAEWVRSGRAVSLARETALASGVERGLHEVTLRPSGSRDFIGMVFHGFAMTHLDALVHAWADGERMYNGIPRTAVTERGAEELGVEVIAVRGISGRGVLLDVAGTRGGPLEPGTAIFPADLERAEAEQGVRAGPGDLLFVRTGAGPRNTRERRSGLHPECLPWLRAREIALLGGDGDNDVAPLPGFDRWASAMHGVAIPYLGMPLVDNAALDELAAACREEGRWAFLLTIAPLRIRGATGSPVNPVALL